MMLFVRSASSRDLATVSELLHETWHATYDSIYGCDRVAEITAEWHSPARLAEHLAWPDSEFIVADDGKTIAGMAYARMISENCAVLHQLYVLPAWQGKGAGNLLLQEICRCFPQAETLRLEVEAANIMAIAFYERHGFNRAGATSNCGNADSGIPALVYEKRLA